MTIHLPPHIESSIRAAVQGGRFASLDEAMTEAARLLLRELNRRQPPTASPTDAGNDTPDPIMGLMRDHAELMDEIVADAYRRRREAEPPSDPLLGAWREDADLLDEIVEHAMKVREERP